MEIAAFLFAIWLLITFFLYCKHSWDDYVNSWGEERLAKENLELINQMIKDGEIDINNEEIKTEE